MIYIVTRRPSIRRIRSDKEKMTHRKQSKVICFLEVERFGGMMPGVQCYSRIRIRKFWVLSDPYPLVRGTAPDSDPDPPITLDFYCFVISIWLFCDELCKCNKQNHFFSSHLEGHWRKKQDPDPDPYEYITDPELRQRLSSDQTYGVLVLFSSLTPPPK
jgi:hypothetical protein